MTTVSFGPTITYATDPSLSMTEHKRILREVVHAAEDFMLRVAFRLPETPDEEFYSLVDWYWDEEARSNPGNGLQSPLYHYRPSLPDHYPDAEIWMPARSIGAGIAATAYSVHNQQDAQRAVLSGASEVIFGHVFESESHPHEAGRGVSELLKAQERISDKPGITLTAIGGIDEGSMHAMGTIGMMSVACIRAISTSPDIYRTLRTMHKQWNRGFEELMEKGHHQ